MNIEGVLLGNSKHDFIGSDLSKIWNTFGIVIKSFKNN